MSAIMRRRIAALLLLAGVVVLVLALADTGPFDDPPTAEERVEQTVTQLYAAAAEGDFATYCSLLTPAARNLVRVNAARLARDGQKLGGCARILGLARDALAGVELRVRQVSVSGNRARVEANLKLPDRPGAEPRTIYLELDERGVWRVADPG